MPKKILVTGGAGYIGSHTVVELIQAGYQPIVIDSLCNSDPNVIKCIKKITGITPPFYEIDIRDQDALARILKEHHIQSVIHFAALKAVGESTKNPTLYFDNNIGGVISLIKAMQQTGVHQIVFSSSATVYGIPETLPLREDCRIQAINPYGTTKVIAEQLLNDMATFQNWQVINLRYFNPVGAHPSGFIGESPNDTPNNLMPYLCEVAAGAREKLYIFGNDYPTKDGTCIRDYIHVVDLARAHVCALKKINDIKDSKTYNLGTGQGYSVLEVLNAFIQENGIKILHEFSDRRPGDAPTTYADPSLAQQELGWKASQRLTDMVKDSWNFIKKSRENKA